MSDGGKGSKPRPRAVSDEEYESRWDVIFGRDKPKEAEPESETIAELPYPMIALGKQLSSL
jgi:hypothetical protein